MNKVTFVLGGARSGKSNYALKLAGSGWKVAFIATCLALDEEMKKRIELHKEKRPNNWQTFEEPKDIAGVLKKIGSMFDVVIIDCLTLLISNLFLGKLNDSSIENKINEMMDIVKADNYKSIIVSNEVGLGIVPDNELGRKFRDLAGRVNQIVAQKSDDVVFMVSGLALKVK